MQTYDTREGDTVDGIAWRQYGTVNSTILRAVLDANPGLADAGAILPAGLAVSLPILVTTAEESQGVSLWT